jgi:hypothetical protein
MPHSGSIASHRKSQSVSRVDESFGVHEYIGELWLKLEKWEFSLLSRDDHQ